MIRRRLLQLVAGTPVFGLLTACSSEPASAALNADFPPLQKTNEQWRALLPQDRYEVLFDEATERPGSSPLDKEYGDGTYICAACYLPLFESAKKYDSGTGWPSFSDAIAGHYGIKKDFKLILPRTEYHCARCGGHQGHRFADGPRPTGQRWCNNGLALEFVAAGTALPELRV